jgi:hypothetical protein
VGHPDLRKGGMGQCDKIIGSPGGLSLENIMRLHRYFLKAGKPETSKRPEALEIQFLFLHFKEQKSTM